MPPTGKVKLPSDGLREQAATGKVEVPLRTLVSSLQEDLQPAFASANLDALVKIPLQDVHAAFSETEASAPTASRIAAPASPQQGPNQPPPLAGAPSAAIDQAPSPAPPSSSQTSELPKSASAFSSPPGQSNRQIAPSTVDTPPVDDAPITDLNKISDEIESSPPPESPDEDTLKPLKWEPQPKDNTIKKASAHASDLKNPLTPVVDVDEESEPMDSLEPLPIAKAPKEAPKSSDPTAQKTSKLGSLPPLKGSKTKEPEKTLPSTASKSADDEEATDSKEDESREVKSASKIESKSKQDVAPAKALSRGPDFMLRAFLGMTGTPACRDVVEHCSGLEGVDECVVLRAGEVVKGTVSDSGRLSDLASSAFEKVSGFVNEIGISNAEALNLQMGEGTLSFFVHEDACLAVMQNSSGLGPGVNERLTLMSQLLGTIPAEPES